MEERLTHRSDRFNEGLREILKKSSRLMADVGYHGTSMRELSKATDRSLSGLYHYFSGKEDLLYLINYQGFTTLNDMWKRMEVEFDDTREKLYGFVYLHTRYYVENIDEMRVMNWGTQALEFETAMTIRKLKARYTASARRIVKDILESRGNGECDPKRVARETYLLFGMMNWIFGWYSSRAHGRVDDLIRDIYRTFVHGVSANGTRDSETTRIECKASRAFERCRCPDGRIVRNQSAKGQG